MKTDLPHSWKIALGEELEKDYFQELSTFVSSQYAEAVCFPPRDCLFEAFSLSTFEKTRVVILGQDPYPNHGQAHGLCFSVNYGVKFPPSLKNIFRELEKDTGQPIPLSGNLEHWASQGVLLLNATLSVRAGETGSHTKKGWERFTDKVIATISDQKEHVVFLLWGAQARKKSGLIDKTKHLILESGHPSPLSAIRGHWFGNRHFTRTNAFLEEKGLPPINW